MEYLVYYIPCLFELRLSFIYMKLPKLQYHDLDERILFKISKNKVLRNFQLLRKGKILVIPRSGSYLRIAFVIEKYFG